MAASLRVAGTTPYYGANGIQDYVDGYTHDGEFILVAEDGANDLKNYPVKCVKGRIWVNNHAHVLQGKYDCADNQFLAYAISQADIESLLVGGGRAKLNAETLMGIDLLLPNKAEQIRIGKYLAQLDNLITLHQREFAFLCKEKSKKFRYIKNAWEQRKLGEVLKERTERAKGDEELLSVTIANGVIRQIDSEKRNTASEDRSNYKIVKKGDVPYNSMRMWQGAVGNSKYNGIVSPAYTILTPTSEANGKFFMELFKKKSTLQIFQRWSQGLTSDTWNLKYPILSSIQFAIPSVEEQEKIAEYFSSLDHLITLHQRKPNFYTGGYYAE